MSSPAQVSEAEPVSGDLVVERTRASAGFTLIEVLVALGIMVIGISAAIALFAAATAAHKRAINRTNAASIAEQAIADIESSLLRGQAPTELAENLPFEGLKRDYPGYDVAAKFYFVEPDEENVKGALAADHQLVVEVIITWTSQGQPREERFRQLITRGLLLR